KPQTFLGWNLSASIIGNHNKSAYNGPTLNNFLRFRSLQIEVSHPSSLISHPKTVNCPRSTVTDIQQQSTIPPYLCQKPCSRASFPHTPPSSTKKKKSTSLPSQRISKRRWLPVCMASCLAARWERRVCLPPRKERL